MLTITQLTWLAGLVAGGQLGARVRGVLAVDHVGELVTSATQHSTVQYSTVQDQPHLVTPSSSSSRRAAAMVVVSTVPGVSRPGLYIGGRGTAGGGTLLTPFVAYLVFRWRTMQ